MSIGHEHVKGVRLTSRPTGVSKCGMSRARFAADYKTQQWYELSTKGGVIGTPTDFDFYRKFEGESAGAPADPSGKGLARV